MTSPTQHRSTSADPDGYLDGVPHETFAYLRRDAPVLLARRAGRARLLGGDPLRRRRRRQPRHRARSPPSAAPRCSCDADAGGARAVAADDAQHGPARAHPLRKLGQPGLHAAHDRRRSRSASRAGLRRRSSTTSSSKGECDFVTDVAAELPLQVIAEILGVPQEDRRQDLRLEQPHDRLRRPRVPAPRRGRRRTPRPELFAYANELGRRAPRPTRATTSSACCIQPEVDGERADRAWSSTCSSCCWRWPATRPPATPSPTACSPSSSTPTSGSGCSTTRRSSPTAVEEMLRWVTPVMHFRRTATRDTELGGQAIRPGDKVVIWYISANRDEAVFDDPYRFDVGRDTRTSTWPSAAAARTSASAPTWPGSRSR